MARILLVEDNALNRELTAELLELHGHDVLLAASGEEALKLAGELRPALILLDITLPGGMDGLAVVRQLKSQSELSAIPVVAVTAHAMKGDEQRALDGGFSGYISKPIDTRDFLARVQGFLTFGTA
jgi:CheY-like chemotaxis protein